MAMLEGAFHHELQGGGEPTDLYEPGSQREPASHRHQNGRYGVRLVNQVGEVVEQLGQLTDE
jgi:hypothetical protein